MGIISRQFKALADPTRLRIFCFLRDCGQPIALDDEGACRIAAGTAVGEVCCRFAQSQSTISHHLKELRDAGLIQMRREGRHVYCAVNEKAVASLGQFLAGAERELASALDLEERG